MRLDSNLRKVLMCFGSSMIKNTEVEGKIIIIFIVWSESLQLCRSKQIFHMLIK